jgi:hypothetical protein
MFFFHGNLNNTDFIDHSLLRKGNRESLNFNLCCDPWYEDLFLITTVNTEYL